MLDELPVVWILISGIVGSLGGWFACYARERTQRTLSFVTGVAHGRRFAGLDATDPSPEELAALSEGHALMWDLNIQRRDLHERLAGAGVGL